MKRLVRALTIVFAASLALVGCSSSSSAAGTFGYQTAFTRDNMEYTISEIRPAETTYKKYSMHNGIMYVTVNCKALEDGAEPNLEGYLTMYDSSGHENSEVLGVEGGESTVGKLKTDTEGSFVIGYGYDYDEPWYELQYAPSTNSDPVSFKFSINPDTFEVSIVE